MESRLPPALGPILVVALVQCLLGIWLFATVLVTASNLDLVAGVMLVSGTLSLGVTGVALLSGERRDPRAAWLGTSFLLAASLFAAGVSLRVRYVECDLPLPLEVLDRLPVGALLPFALWQFASEFPRAIDSPRVRRVLMFGTNVALYAGVALLLANFVGFDSGTRLESLEHTYSAGTFHWLTQLIILAALLMVGVRFRRAADRDRERGRRLLLPLGLILGVVAVSTLTIATNAAGVADFDSNWGLTVTLMAACILLLLPLGPLLGRAVVDERVLEARLFAPRLVWSALRRGMPSAVVAGAVAAFTALLLRSAPGRHRESSAAAAVWELPWLGTLFAVAVVATAWFFARRFLRRDDGFHEMKAIDGLLEELRSVDAPFSWHAWLQSARTTLKFERLLLVATGSSLAPEWQSQVADTIDTEPLRSLFALRTEPLEIESVAAHTEAKALPEATRRWLLDHPVVFLQPLFDTAGEVLAVLAVGDRLDQQPFFETDFAALDRLAAASALLLERKRLETVGTTKLDAAEMSAAECWQCGRVWAAEQHRCSECDAELQPIEEPLVVAGKFELERRIGSGSLGKVYAARDAILGRRVAIKLLPGSTRHEQRSLSREARAMASFQHAGLATVYGAELSDTRLFVVSELLEGGTLAQRITERARENASWPEKEVIALGVELLEALGPLHQRDLVHGDVKPSNIGFDKEGKAKLLDFGMVRLLDDTPLRGTPEVDDYRASTVLPGGHAGTPLYSPPEAWRGERVGTAADLWPVGVLLFELMAGIHPFERSHADATEAARRTRAVILKAECNEWPPDASVSPRFLSVLNKSLDAEPGLRFVDAASFRSALLQL